MCSCARVYALKERLREIEEELVRQEELNRDQCLSLQQVPKDNDENAVPDLFVTLLPVTSRQCGR